MDELLEFLFEVLEPNSINVKLDIPNTAQFKVKGILLNGDQITLTTDTGKFVIKVTEE